MSSSQDTNCKSHFWPKVTTKNGLYHFYPSAKSRRGLKIKTSGVIFWGACAYHVQKTITPPKQAVCQFSDKTFCQKCLQIFCFNVEKWNVGDHLKRVFPKFEAERSHPRVVNDRPKFRIFQKCKTLNGRLPTKNASHRRQTWWTSISDDSAHFIMSKNFGKEGPGELRPATC